MKRNDLLKQNLTEEKNVEVLVSDVAEQDRRFLKREQRALEDQIEDLQVELKKRLSSKSPLDKSTVEVTYAAIKTAKDKLELYKEFDKEFVG